MTGRNSAFSACPRDPYANDVYRAGVDAIARLAAKFTLQPTVKFSDGTTANADERLARVLQVEPNPLMTAYDMLYMLTTHLYTRNNAYVYVHRDGGRVVALYPLHVSGVSYLSDAEGRIWADFTFANGRRYALPYSDIVHLRRHYNAHDVNGDGNEAIYAGLSLADVQNKGIESAIKSAASLRGVLKFTQIMAPDKLEENKNRFVEDYLTVENSGGVVPLDNSMEYVPLESKPVTISKEDQDSTKAKIYGYLGISDEIVTASFTDDEFGAFCESVIEALALQYSLEFTRKVYTPAQVARGRSIACTSSRLQFMSNSSKVEVLNSALPMGVITINQALDVLGLPRVADGDRYIQSLNYVSRDIADEYQLHRSGFGGVSSLAEGGFEQ